jgi:hypothetical protein
MLYTAAAGQTSWHDYAAHTAGFPQLCGFISAAAGAAGQSVRHSSHAGQWGDDLEFLPSVKQVIADFKQSMDKAIMSCLNTNCYAAQTLQYIASMTMARQRQFDR